MSSNNNNSQNSFVCVSADASYVQGKSARQACKPTIERRAAQAALAGQEYDANACRLLACHKSNMGNGVSEYITAGSASPV